MTDGISQRWASYLEDQMQRREWFRNVDLVNASGLKPNGRPVIDQSRLSVWRRGTARPSYAHAKLVGEIFEDVDGALRAAGYRLLKSDGQPVVEVEDGDAAVTIAIPPDTPTEVIESMMRAANEVISTYKLTRERRDDS
jgi:hypothetical protein